MKNNITYICLNFFLILLFCMLISGAVLGEELKSSTCSQADVSMTINMASEGDTVIIPGGNCVWSGAILISKIIVIKGAGIDQTSIAGGAFHVSGGSGKGVRITGLTMTGGATSWQGTIDIRGGIENFRIDHISFNKTREAISTEGYSYGVIDHCIFSNGVGTGVRVKDAFPGNAARLRAVPVGTSKAVYIEDCIFEQSAGDAPIDAQSGGSFVFRYNSVVSSFITVHGSDSPCPERGVYSYEIYENSISNPGMEWFTAFFMRGGTGVIYNNKITGNYQTFIQLVNQRSSVSPDSSTMKCATTTWGLCNGSSAWDGNQENGWPCLDQIGRGREESSPPSSTGSHWQESYPLYIWGNTFRGVNARAISNSSHIVEGRDFFNTAKNGYSPYIYPHPISGKAPMVPKNLRIEQ